MNVNGYITQDESIAAQDTELTVVNTSALTQSFKAPYFAEEIRRTLQTEFGNDGLYKQGMIVKSSVEPTLQEIAAKALQDGLTAYDLRHGYRGAVKTLKSFDNWQQQLSDIPTQYGMMPTWKLAVILDVRDIGFADGSKGKLSQGGLKWGGDKIKKGSVMWINTRNHRHGRPRCV